MVGGERRADGRVRRALGRGQRAGQQPPRQRRLDLGEGGARGRLAGGPARAAGLAGAAPLARAPGRGRGTGLAPVRRRQAGVPAVVQQLADLRGDPSVPGQAAGVVVHDDDQGVLFLPGVAEDADDLITVAVGVGIDVALGGFDRAHVVGPGRPGHAALHLLQGGLLSLGALPRGAQAGDARQQGQGRRAALLGRVGHQALADQFLDVGPAAAGRAHPGPAGLLAPPGAEQLADHQLRVQRAADGQQLAGGAQHLGEQRVRRRGGQAEAAPFLGS